MTVPILATAPAVDAALTGWDKAPWVTIDVRTKQVGDWGHQKQEAKASVAVDGTKLYAAFRTGEPKTLENAGTALPNLFKTGGALDLMLGTDPQANPARRTAVAGDLRLLVALVKGKPVAVLYRPVVPGATGDGVPFGSPMRTIRFAEVKDVSADVVFAAGADGEFVFAIPLATLGLQPTAGMTLRGDIGLLRGTAIETTQRAYWTNKATGLTSDIPSEAELTPHLWGQFIFKAP